MLGLVEAHLLVGLAALGIPVHRRGRGRRTGAVRFDGDDFLALGWEAPGETPKAE